jgi:hypothetical protein
MKNLRQNINFIKIRINNSSIFYMNISSGNPHSFVIGFH